MFNYQIAKKVVYFGDHIPFFVCFWKTEIADRRVRSRETRLCYWNAFDHVIAAISAAEVAAVSVCHVFLTQKPTSYLAHVPAYPH